VSEPTSTRCTRRWSSSCESSGESCRRSGHSPAFIVVTHAVASCTKNY
jgi:hypothetical protein